VSEPPPIVPPPDPVSAAAPSARKGAPGWWGAARALAGLGVLLVLTALASGIVAGIDGGEIDSLAARLSVQAILALALVGVAYWIAQAQAAESGETPFECLGLRRPVRPAIKLSVLAYVAYIACAIVVSSLLDPEQEDITRELGFDEGTLGAIAAGILIVVAAPISEEVFFRGLLFSGFRRSGGFIIGAVASAGIWGLFHYTGPDSWPVILQLSIFGVILARLYDRTGSIWPPIAVHAVNNAIAFSVLASS